jgi:predicted Zn-dependent peptidase
MPPASMSASAPSRRAPSPAIVRRATAGRRGAGEAVIALPNGVRVLVLPMPELETAAVSVYVRAGSVHETPERGGISHVVEHMAFKGTATRDARAINLDAEQLGADVNAHTDRDHTAFHMRGLGRHAPDFVRMLGDIVRESVFPDDELERERGVLLAEYAEDEDDPVAGAYRLFDALCWGAHPAARPVIGSRRTLRRLRRADLVEHVRALYTGSNVVVGIAGGVDTAAVTAAAAQAFGPMPPGRPNAVPAPAWLGGLKRRAHEGSSQSHAVLGFPAPGLRAQDPAASVAAALFGEGMSSPLLLELRERRGLAYHASCNADALERWGQFVIELSTAPEALDEALSVTARLLRAHARRIDRDELERARRQVIVRELRALERPELRLEHAALELLATGRLRPHDELRARIEALGARPVQAAFERMLAREPALAISGSYPRAAGRDFARLLR